MSESFVVPGKIFLMGEYSVIQGGKALVAALNPSYEYEVGQTTDGSALHIHPESPAGKYLADKNYHTSLAPKNVGLGAGFGTSTAELIALAMNHVSRDLNAAKLWAWYLDKFPKASGADLAVQLAAMRSGRGIFEVSGKNEVNAMAATTIKTSVLYQNIFIFQNSPAQKLATHVDLKKDFVYLNLELANAFHDRLKAAFCHGSLSQLVVMTEWAEWLAQLGLETELARTVRLAFLDLPEVVAAKGCGAGLHDVFLVVVKNDACKNIAQIAAEITKKHNLRFLGSLGDRLWSSAQSFAPVNIAWIKYMGKNEGAPANSSLSMTLDRVGTTTQMTAQVGEQKIVWDDKKYVPPLVGQAKVEKFLWNTGLWSETLAALGFEVHFPQSVFISTSNNVPAGAGIATSASAFAALTLAWASLLVGDDKKRFQQKYEAGDTVKKALAQIAQKGSGSACRSFLGPWVEWVPAIGIKEVSAGKQEWTDFILLIEEESKAVSSSEAHERVKSSPRWPGRAARATQRLADVKEALRTDRISDLQKSVFAEAIDMHELFHTAEPPFSYWKPESKAWIKKYEECAPSLPSQNAVITLDAGANVHWFVPTEEEKQWHHFFNQQKVKFLTATSGRGAYLR